MQVAAEELRQRESIMTADAVAAPRSGSDGQERVDLEQFTKSDDSPQHSGEATSDGTPDNRNTGRLLRAEVEADGSIDSLLSSQEASAP